MNGVCYFTKTQQNTIYLPVSSRDILCICARNAHAHTHVEDARRRGVLCKFRLNGLYTPTCHIRLASFSIMRVLIPAQQGCIYCPIVPGLPPVPFNASSCEMSAVRERNSKSTKSIGLGINGDLCRLMKSPPHNNGSRENFTGDLCSTILDVT